MAFRLGECLLQQQLDKRNISQSEFARRMKCSRQHVNNLIKGKRVMSLEFAINASYILNCDLKDLYEIVVVGE